MSQKAVRWLYQQLPDLVAKGVLSQEAADKIKQHFGEIKETSRTSVILFFCGVVGAIFIGLGIILLLAHNWENLSRTTRALVSFAPLLLGQGLALGALLKRPASAAFKEASATFLSLMVAASIALVCQTYHIPGETGAFVITWMLLILPLVYLLEASLPAAIYLVGVTSWAGSHWNDPARMLLFWPLALAVVPHFIWAVRREIYTLRSTILSFAMICCFSVGAGFTLRNAFPDSWLVVLPATYAVFYLLASRPFDTATANWQRPWRVLGSLALFVHALLLTFRFAWKEMADFGLSEMGWEGAQGGAPVEYLITVALIGAAGALFLDTVRRRDTLASLFGALPFLAMGGYCLRGQPPVFTQAFFNAYLFVLSVSHILIGGRRSSLGTVNMGMLMLAVLIITRFFDSDIGFILKGLVFICVGVGFLLTNIWLARRPGGVR